jgi:hypothetical protein
MDGSTTLLRLASPLDSFSNSIAENPFPLETNFQEVVDLYSKP